MVLDAEKRRKLGELVTRRKAALAGVGTLTPARPPPVATSASISPEPAPIDHRQKGVVEATVSEDEDTYTGLVFKRKRGTDVTVSAHSSSDGCASFFWEKPPSASSPRALMVHEGGGGRMSLGAILECLLLLNCLPSSRRFFKPSKAGK